LEPEVNLTSVMPMKQNIQVHINVLVSFS